jgi:hypothetical protein
MTRTVVACRIRYLAWCAILTGCGGQQSTPGLWQGLEAPAEPEIAISPPDASGAFHFSYCGTWTTESPQIFRIFVSRPGVAVDSVSSAANYECIWRRAGGPTLTTEWRYGSSPGGSKITGPCAPLDADGTHVITVSGVGLGSLEFRVNEQGIGAAVADACSKHPSEHNSAK